MTRFHTYIHYTHNFPRSFFSIFFIVFYYPYSVKEILHGFVSRTFSVWIFIFVLRVCMWSKRKREKKNPTTLRLSQRFSIFIDYRHNIDIITYLIFLYLYVSYICVHCLHIDSMKAKQLRTNNDQLTAATAHFNKLHFKKTKFFFFFCSKMIWFDVIWILFNFLNFCAALQHQFH